MLFRSNDTATTEIYTVPYTLSLHDALPISCDDRTDEDAFRALEKRGIGILVSEQPHVTAASYSLNNPEEVEEFLQKITGRLHAKQL